MKLCLLSHVALTQDKPRGRVKWWQNQNKSFLLKVVSIGIFITAMEKIIQLHLKTNHFNWFRESIGQNSALFHDKNTQQTRNYLNMTKSRENAHIKHHTRWQILKSSEHKKGEDAHLLQYLLNLEGLTRAIKQEKSKYRTFKRKERSKMFSLQMVLQYK